VGTGWLLFVAFIALVLAAIGIPHGPYLAAGGFAAGALLCLFGAVLIWRSARLHWVSLVAVAVSFVLVFVSGRLGP
jgi:hypothetical protein